MQASDQYLREGPACRCRASARAREVRDAAAHIDEEKHSSTLPADDPCDAHKEANTP